MNRFLLAWRCFFQILFNTPFFERVNKLFEHEQVKEIPKKEEVKKDNFDTIRALSLLQRDARFIDFLQEQIDSYSDAQVGAVARNLHRECKKVIDNYIKIEPVLPDEEGNQVNIEKGFDPSAIRLVGNVTGEPPFKGTLRHHGWKVKDLKLTPLPENQDPTIIEPAEVEI